MLCRAMGACPWVCWSPKLLHFPDVFQVWDWPLTQCVLIPLFPCRECSPLTCWARLWCRQSFPPAVFCSWEGAWVEGFCLLWWRPWGCDCALGFAASGFGRYLNPQACILLLPGPGKLCPALQLEQGDSIKQLREISGLDLVSSPKPQIWFVCFSRGLLWSPALCWEVLSPRQVQLPSPGMALPARYGGQRPPLQLLLAAGNRKRTRVPAPQWNCPGCDSPFLGVRGSSLAEERRGGRVRAQAALPGRARPWHLLHQLRTVLVFLKPFFLLVYFKP